MMNTAPPLKEPQLLYCTVVFTTYCGVCFVCVAVYLSDFTTDLTLLVGRSDFSVYLLCVGPDSVKTCKKNSSLCHIVSRISFWIYRKCWCWC